MNRGLLPSAGARAADILYAALVNLSARVASAASVLALLLVACGSSGTGGTTTTTSTTGEGDAGSAATTGTGVGGDTSMGGQPATSSSTGSPGCDQMLLHTGLTAQQTGISVDAYDCSVLEWTAKDSEPDPMIFKAIIYVESRFDNKAVACPNDPCGVPAGWTVAEAGCYGVMQVVPACGGFKAGLLANGHPDLVSDPASSDWPNSIFNPEIGIELGIGGIAFNRSQVKAQFPGCTEDQYTIMAVGDFNSYGSATGCTTTNMAYVGPVLDAYKQYAAAAGYPAHAY